jgi:hypothetical protein
MWITGELERAGFVPRPAHPLKVKKMTPGGTGHAARLRNLDFGLWGWPGPISTGSRGFARGLRERLAELLDFPSIYVLPL